jgi:hypothetical protein
MASSRPAASWVSMGRRESNLGPKLRLPMTQKKQQYEKIFI